MVLEKTVCVDCMLTCNIQFHHSRRDTQRVDILSQDSGSRGICFASFSVFLKQRWTCSFPTQRKSVMRNCDSVGPQPVARVWIWWRRSNLWLDWVVPVTWGRTCDQRLQTAVLDEVGRWGLCTEIRVSRQVGPCKFWPSVQIIIGDEHQQISHDVSADKISTDLLTFHFKVIVWIDGTVGHFTVGSRVHQSPPVFPFFRYLFFYLSRLLSFLLHCFLSLLQRCFFSSLSHLLTKGQKGAKLQLTIWKANGQTAWGQTIETGFGTVIPTSSQSLCSSSSSSFSVFSSSLDDKTTTLLRLLLDIFFLSEGRNTQTVANKTEHTGTRLQSPAVCNETQTQVNEL